VSEGSVTWPHTLTVFTSHILKHTQSGVVTKAKLIACLTNHSITMTADFKKAEILHSSLKWSLCTLGLCSQHYLNIQAGNGSGVELL